jgi:hypothetical protein
MTGAPDHGDLDHLFQPARGRARRTQICAARGKWVPLAPHASHDLTISGSGVLRKLWCVFNPDGKPLEAMRTLTEHRDFYRNIWIHIAFDDSDAVQVSAPVSDFFLCGHGDIDDVDSALFQSVRIPPLDERPYQGALTCFAPMPFAECAKISFVNRNGIPARMIAGFDWLQRDDLPAPLHHFHASFTHKRSHAGPMVLLDRREAEGAFIGLGLYVNNRDRTLRWHEGAERFDIDGDRQPLVGTGGEDYFCLAWGFRRPLSRPLFGVTCARPHDGAPSLRSGTFNPAGEFAMYRFHLPDRIPFTRSLRLAFPGASSGRPENAMPLEFRSVAYWYGRPRAA